MEITARIPGPAARYRHLHTPVRSVNKEFQDHVTFGQRIADIVALVVGSWAFIIVQTLLLALWMAVNVWLVYMEHAHPGFLKSWDPYPFILLNLVLSFQAAYTGPVVMMSQNRQNEKDRLTAQNDFDVDTRAEEEIKVIMEHLAHQDELIRETLARLDALQKTQAELVARLPKG